MSRFKQPVSVLVVIHTCNLDVLMLERVKNPGFWQSVTGSREGEEDLIVTAAREVGEETGLDASRFQLSDWQQTNHYEIFKEWRHRYAPGVSENTEHVFGLLLPECLPITTAPEEHRQALWLNWQEAAEMCFSASNREAILELPARIAACQDH